LGIKIRGALTSFLYFELKDRSKIITTVRLWKSLTNNMDDIMEVDKKFKNSTSIKVNATILNLTDSELKKFIEEINIADEDIIIVET
jgi:maltose-binding protein MalE